MSYPPSRSCCLVRACLLPAECGVGKMPCKSPPPPQVRNGHPLSRHRGEGSPHPHYCKSQAAPVALTRTKAGCRTLPSGLFGFRRLPLPSPTNGRCNRPTPGSLARRIIGGDETPSSGKTFRHDARFRRVARLAQQSPTNQSHVEGEIEMISSRHVAGCATNVPTIK